MFSKTLLVLLVVYFVSDYSNGQKYKKFFRNDYTYIEETEGFYKYHTVLRTWSDAKKTCALEGASLFYPENDNEAHAVISHWNATRAWYHNYVYIGISGLEAKGVYTTIDGKPISDVYNNWQPGEPSNSLENENCVTIGIFGTQYDVQCFSKYPFICKKSLVDLKWNEECNMPNLDYTFNKATGTCYKFHMTPLNWTDAYTVCSAEQSHLAVINSQLEADNLVKLTETVPKDRVTGNYLRGIYHLGFHNQFDEGWRTVKGGSLNEYNTWWSNYQPDAAGHDQCGAMFYNGHLTHVHCDTKCFFICEHEGIAASTTARPDCNEYQQ